LFDCGFRCVGHPVSARVSWFVRAPVSQHYSHFGHPFTQRSYSTGTRCKKLGPCICKRLEYLTESIVVRVREGIYERCVIGSHVCYVGLKPNQEVCKRCIFEHTQISVEGGTSMSRSCSGDAIGCWGGLAAREGRAPCIHRGRRAPTLRCDAVICICHISTITCSSTLRTEIVAR
jgi:hypothetical protein